MLPKRVKVCSFGFGGVIPNPRVARISEAPSKQIHRVRLGSLGQQREQTPVLQAAAVEAVQEHERGVLLAAFWRRGAHAAGHHGTSSAGNVHADLSRAASHLHRRGLFKRGDFIGEERGKLRTRSRADDEGAARDAASGTGRPRPRDRGDGRSEGKGGRCHRKDEVQHRSSDAVETESRWLSDARLLSDPTIELRQIQTDLVWKSPHEKARRLTHTGCYDIT